MAVRTVRPGSDLAGSWEKDQPLPVGAGYEALNVIATGSAGYQGGDSNAVSVQNAALALPAIGNAAPTEIELVDSSFLTYADAPATSFNITLPATPIVAGDLIIIDTSTQEGTDPGAPTTPTDFTQRFSHYTTSPNPWIPRVTRFWKIAVGGEESDVIAIPTASTRMHAKATVWRNVDTANPFPSTQVQNHWIGTPDPDGDITGLPEGAVVLSTVASNVYPDGADSYNSATDGPAGYSLVAENASEERFWLEYYRTIPSGGTEEPGNYSGSFDQWTHITDAIAPSSGQGSGDIALILFTAVADDLGTPDISAFVPEVAATDERQRITSNAIGVNFSLTYNGATTATIANDATAATIEAALEALATIGVGNVNVTGGPIDENPVTVQFIGALAAIDVGLITSVNQLDIVQTVRGTAGFTFVYEWEFNTPTGDDPYQPQIQIWSAVPSNYVDGDGITFTNSNHQPLHTWSAALLVLEGADNADLLGAVAADSIGESARAAFGSLTTTIPGSKLIAILGKAISGHYSGDAPTATPPFGRTATVRAEADAMTLEVFESAAVAATLHETTDAIWTGTEFWATGVVPIKPASSAGTATIAATLSDQSDDTWVDIAHAAGNMYEVVELDLGSLPTGRVVTGLGLSVRHQSPERNSLRVEMCAINDDGTIVTSGEKRGGGYIPDPVGETQVITTGQWTELSDGTPLSDYSRFGVVLYSTSRAPTLTTHKVFTVDAEVEYVEGGPVVSNVVGPTAEGSDVTWDYASDAGLQQTHTQVKIVKGFDQDPSADYETLYYNRFDGDASGGPIQAETYFASESEIELYGPGPGNAENGFRDPDTITIQEEVTSTAGGDGNILRITAKNGTGDQAGSLVSGGLKFRYPITYGQFEFRARGSGDPDELFSTVAIGWPKASTTRFPDSDNASGDEGEWPAGGELDIMENFSNRDTLTPVETHIHRLKLGATPPYDSTDDETLDFTHTGIDGTDWHKYVLTWEPGLLHLEIDDGTVSTTLTTDPDWIPDWDMEFTFQLDAWENTALTGGNNPTLDLDYILVRRKVNQTVPDELLNPQDGDVVLDTGKVAGSLTREYTMATAPIGSGNLTALVRAWALLPSGVEVASAWAFDTFDITGNPAANPTQLDVPVFNAETGGVEIMVTVPAGVSRAWLARSVDEGATWTLLDPFDVSPSSTATLVDYEAPLAQRGVRYDVVFDNGPNSESTGSQPVGDDATARFGVTSAGRVKDPDGVEVVGTGGNFATGIEGIDNYGLTLWANESAPRYTIRHDVTDGIGAGTELFPASYLTGHSNVFDATAGGSQDIPDRAYAFNGTMSPAAIAAGITAPVDNWRMRIARLTCWLRSGSSTYPGAIAGSLDASDTIPQYLANAQQLEQLGMIPVPEHHGLTGADPVLPAALVSDPTLATSDGAFSDDAIRDECDFLDALAAGLDPARSWISLANEPYTGSRSTAFDDFVVTLVRRLRSAGWTGIIVVPTARYCQDLGQIANGDYNTLVDRLATHSVEHDLVWDWHCYGNNHDGVSASEYTYAEMDSQLSTIRAGVSGYRFALWLGEYGEHMVRGEGLAGSNDAWNRTAVDILTTATYGRALALKHPWIMPTLWHMTGDHYYSHGYSPTTGERNKGLDPDGPDPIPSSSEDALNTNPGRLPWHDVDGSAVGLEWLTRVGRAHWDLGHSIDGTGLSLGRDTSTQTTEWYFIVPSAPELNMKPDIAGHNVVRPVSSVSVVQPGGAAVAIGRSLPHQVRTTVRTKNRAERDALNAVLESGARVRIVNILGDEWYCQLADDIGQQLERWKPLDEEITGLRDGHTITIDWLEVGNL